MGARGYRNGQRGRQLLGTLGRVELDLPRARMVDAHDGGYAFHSTLLPRNQHLTNGPLSVIAGAYWAGVNTQRVRRALAALFGGAVSKDTVSRAWHKIVTDFKAWNPRRFDDEAIVRLIPDGTVVKVQLDRKATALSILGVVGVRADGQKVWLTLNAMGGESAEAWREVLDGLVQRGLRKPELVMTDGGKGPDAALAALWPAVPVRRWTVPSTGTCWPTRPSSCTRRSPRMTPT
ncbi:MAG: transposase [Rhodanobacteraceae bacterium]